MIKNSYVGIVDKIRVIKMFPKTMVRFTLHTNYDDVNCLISKKELANLILFLDENKYEVSIYGRYNRRKQFVVEKFFVRNPDSFVREFILKPMASIA